MDLLTIPYQYFASLYHSVAAPRIFDDVKTFVMFIGYPRSGHTLVGFLLDAHANMVVASQTSALKYLKRGFGRQQIFYLLMENSRRVSRTGREQRRYSYDVPNQWQGSFERLQVIGESTGLTRLRRNPSQLKPLRQKLRGIDLKLIHVIRNPYDNISTMKLRSGESLPDAIHRYFSMCAIVETMKPQVAPGAIYDFYHESLIENPQSALKNLCDVLGMSSNEGYLNDCASIIYKTAHRSRTEVEWDGKLIDAVKQHMSKFPFLDRYSYHDE